MINNIDQKHVEEILQWNPMTKLREIEISQGENLTIHTINLLIQVRYIL